MIQSQADLRAHYDSHAHLPSRMPRTGSGKGQVFERVITGTTAQTRKPETSSPSFFLLHQQPCLAVVKIFPQVALAMRSRKSLAQRSHFRLQHRSENGMVASLGDHGRHTLPPVMPTPTRLAHSSPRSWLLALLLVLWGE